MSVQKVEKVQATRHIGRYELLKRMGVGGMAEAYLARVQGPEDFEQHVCLKTVLPAFAAEEKFRELFLNEARLSACFRHSNIVQVIDFGEADECLFLALELIDGVDLKALMKAQPDRRLPSDIVMFIAGELAAALEYAHSAVVTPNGQKGVLHRDISPSNVLISRAGEVKLGDFGIAKSMANQEVTQSADLKGKAPYMSPEQLRGERLDARSDLFSLGIMFYEIVVGRRPFDAPNEMVVLQKILSGQRDKLADVAPEGTSPVLIEAIEWLLATDPKERCPSAEALFEKLATAFPPPVVRRTLGQMVTAARKSQRPPADAHRVESHLESNESTKEASANELTGSTVSAVVQKNETSSGTRYQEPIVEPVSAKVHNRGASLLARSKVLAFVGLLSLALIGLGAWKFLNGQDQSPRNKSTVSQISVKPEMTQKGAQDKVTPIETKPLPPSDEPKTAAPVQTAPEPKAVNPVTHPAREPERAGQATKIKVDADPGMKVWIDQRYVGAAPRTVNVKPGLRRIQIGKDGPERTMMVDVKHGQKALADFR